MAGERPRILPHLGWRLRLSWCLMAHLPLQTVGRALKDDARGESRAAKTREREAELAELQDSVRQGGGKRGEGKVRDSGRLPGRARLACLLDEGPSTWFELGQLTGIDWRFQGKQAPGLGVITGIGRVCERLCIVIVNDNTLAAGAWWPGTPEKIQRAQQLALKLGLPVLYLVDCSGLYLPEQRHTFAGRLGAGAIFRLNAQLAARGVVQIAGVCGGSIAGGGYMPLISDRVLMSEQAYMVIAGAALIRGAKGSSLDDIELGGPEMHVHRSGCADERYPDDWALIAGMRAHVSKLPSSAKDFFASEPGSLEPEWPSEELYRVLPPDARSPYAIEDVLGRLLDGSLFWELLPEVGKEVVCGVGRLGGLDCGWVANRQGVLAEGAQMRLGGVLYEQTITKISAFRRACEEDGLPLIWLQDVAGFDIGPDAEARGLLGLGSSLIYGNANAAQPNCTVLLRKASGAGYYAMHGLPYAPDLQLGTVLSRQAVMDGRTLAMARYRPKLDDNFEIASEDPEERAAIAAGMAKVEAQIDADMDYRAMASRGDCDAIVELAQLRSWLRVFVEASYQSTGFRKHKNRRIWSLHDLSRLDLRPR